MTILNGAGRIKSSKNKWRKIMCIVIVKFTNLYCSNIIDGRMPLIENGNSSIYFLPQDHANLFCQLALENENVTQATVYKYEKTYRRR